MTTFSLPTFQGIDFNAIYRSGLSAANQPLDALRARQQTLRAADSITVSLSGLIRNLEAGTSPLTDTGLFTAMKATPSTSGVVSASVGTDAAAGLYDINVSRIATTQVTTSASSYATAGSIAATGGSITFTKNGLTTAAVDVSAPMSLFDLANAINAGNLGETASVSGDATGYKLVITGNATGAAEGFTINNSLTNTAGQPIVFASGQNSQFGNSQNAQNAVFTVNGASSETATNSASGATGLSLNLLKAGNTTVQVERDYSALQAGLASFTSSYQQFLSFYNQQYPALAGQSALGLDSVLREASGSIRSTLLSSSKEGGQDRYLSQVGLAFAPNGQLKLDATKLNAALSSNPDGVKNLVQGTSSNGIFNALQKVLTNLDGTTGLLKAAKTNLDLTSAGYGRQIDRLQVRTDLAQQATLTGLRAASQSMSRSQFVSNSIETLNLTGLMSFPAGFSRNFR